MSCAFSHWSRVMMAGWVGSGDHSQPAAGTPVMAPLMVRWRPKTTWPVYLGLARTLATVEAVQAFAVAGRGVSGSALSWLAMATVPSLSCTRQVKIRATTGAWSGSRTRQVLVAPWAALAGTGWVIRCAAYPNGTGPMLYPARACSRRPFQALSL